MGTVQGSVLPPKLRAGDLIRVIAPSRSLQLIPEDLRPIADRRLGELGLRVSFGEHVLERDAFTSSSVDARVADLHAAFADPEVRGILTVIGGYNANQLPPRLDWDLISANPKVVCGYSDITALQGAILARTGLVTYSGPHWSSFGMVRHFEESLRWFVDCLFGDRPLALAPATTWTDDEWYLDQERRVVRPNQGWWVLAEGQASGRIVGGNLSAVALLHGTPFMPDLDGAVLLLEDDFESRPEHFDRHLTALLQQPGADGVTGLLIGRFQVASRMTRELLETIVRSKPELRGLPVVANLDYGHTSPMITFPVGGRVEVTASAAGAAVKITMH